MLRIKSHQAKLLLLAGSAGALTPMKQLLAALPTDYSLPVVVVLHLQEGDESLMIDGFSRLCALPVKEARDKQPLKNGIVYVAPGGYHLLIEQDACFALSEDEPEHYCRPSIDLLFTSAAACYGSDCAAVLFSGSNKDGAMGVKELCQAGGQVWVQNPAEADYPEMPAAAINGNTDCYVLNTQEIIDEVCCLLRAT